jgi:hypothetical protein
LQQISERTQLSAVVRIEPREGSRYIGFMTNLIRFLLFAIIIGLFGYYLWQQTQVNQAKKEEPKTLPRPTLPKVDPGVEADRKLLMADSKDIFSVKTALLRLAKKKDSLAKGEAMKRAEDPNEIIREAAAEVLSYYPDEMTFIRLQKLARDKNDLVSSTAIKSICAIPGPARLQFLREFKKQDKLWLSQKTAIHLCLLKISNSSQEKVTAFKSLKKIIGNGKDRYQTDAATALIQMMPTDPRVVTMMRVFINKGADRGLEAFSVYQLAQQKDPWLSKNLHRVLFHKERELRRAGLNVLPILCPMNRWLLLTNFFKKKKIGSLFKRVLIY